MVKTKGKNKQKKKSEPKLDDDQEYEDMDSEEVVAAASASSKPGKQVYLPGDPLNEDEELVREESAYEMFHEAQTGKYVRAMNCASYASVCPRASF